MALRDLFPSRFSISVEEKVRRVISEELGVIKGRISPNDDLITELSAEPSDLEAIMKAIEYRFHIKISNENWSEVRTIRDISHLVDVYLEIKQIEL